MKALDELRDELDCRERRIDALSAENARLHAELESMVHGPIARLSAALDLTKGEASFLHALYRAAGALVTLAQLDEVTPAHKGMRDVGNAMRVRAAAVRRALGRETILNVHGKGYALSSAGMARCDAALGRAGEHA